MRASRVASIALVPVLVMGSACSTISKAKNLAQAVGDISKETQDLQNKIASAEKLTFTAEYSLKDSSSTKTFKVVQAPPKGAYITDDSVIVDDGTEVSICSKDSDTKAFQCIASSPHVDGGFFAGGFGAAFNPLAFLPGLQAYAALAGVSTKKTSETFAGQSADCVAFDKTGDDATHFKYCTTAAGILAFSDDGSTVTTLTSYSTDAKASDLAPPAKPQTTDDLLKNATSTTEGTTTTSTTEEATTTTTTEDDSSSSTTSTTDDSGSDSTTTTSTTSP